ncbi:2OG-Fe(II) oxygenase [Candidatus Pacearchaeota archaeon]|nr:2OG-Fe(II) oxygenase [Candidatus Pacearchaeota archaeon]
MKTDIFVNRSVIDSKESLKKQFDISKPFRHVLVKDFLNEPRARKIVQALKKEKFEEKEADLFHLYQTKDLESTNNKVLKEVYSLFSSSEFLEIIKEITGIKATKIDMAGSLYKDTNYLLCHDDQLSGRKIAYILYLSEDFKEREGGSLVFFNSKDKKPTSIAKKYPPLWNSLMLFEVSPISYHEVEENISNKDRYALGGWFH